MGRELLRRRIAALSGIALLSVAMLASLVLLSSSIQNSDSFGSSYVSLLVLNTLGLLTFLVLIGMNIRRLMRHLRAREPGSRLSLRLLTMFLVLSIGPVIVLYSFSLDFLRRGIDSWFDVRIDNALNDALELGREALDVRMRQLLVQTERVAEDLALGTPQRTTLNLNALRQPNSIVSASAWSPGPGLLDDLRERAGAEEFTLFSEEGQLIATSTRATALLPHLPSDPILLQVRHGQSYIGIDPSRQGELFVRAAVVVSLPQASQGKRILHALYPFSARINELSSSVQSAYAKYAELTYLREKLKLSFAMTLTLVLLFSIFSAVWASFYSARRLSAPIRNLAAGTAAVAAGDYTTTLPVESDDDLGVLISSFNEMTARVGEARSEVEAQHEYLDTLMGQLSSGVIALDEKLTVTTLNHSAISLLELDETLGGTITFHELCERLAPLQAVLAELQRASAEGRETWQTQLVLMTGRGRKELICRGRSLSDTKQGNQGHVLVIEDVTAIVQGQRDAAWSEVARRLAHEIKNPLTPIQLATERLRLKCLPALHGSERETLERLTTTIIQQVDTMKTMVATFSDYARSPVRVHEPVNIEQLISGVATLFENAKKNARIECTFQPDLPPLKGDATRLRQVFNNLIKNSLEATPEGRDPLIMVSARTVTRANARMLEIRVEDRGGGIPEHLLGNVFEPYVTSKSRGTGLGLAIVKKAVEEHDGSIALCNGVCGGAVVTMNFPFFEAVNAETHT